LLPILFGHQRAQRLAFGQQPGSLEDCAEAAEIGHVDFGHQFVRSGERPPDPPSNQVVFWGRAWTVPNR
jgi:hypothetical protein